MSTVMECGCFWSASQRVCQMVEESPSMARAAELSAPTVSSLSTLTTFQPLGMRPAKVREPEMPSSPSGNKFAARTVTLRPAGKAMGPVYSADFAVGSLPSRV